MVTILARRRRPASKSSRGLGYRLDRWAHLVRCLGWVRGNFFPHSGCTLELVSGFLWKLGRVWVSRGTAFAISWCKEGREALLYSLAHPDSKEAELCRSRLRRVFLLPREVRDLHKVSKIHLRLYLTALVIMRGEELPPKVDLTPIVTPSSFTPEGLNVFRPYLAEFWRVILQLSPGSREPFRWTSFHFSTKKGPQSSHALLECWQDLWSLPQSL